MTRDEFASLALSYLEEVMSYARGCRTAPPTKDRYHECMEVLSSRVLVRPKDKQRTVDFYSQVLELPIYREFGNSASPGVVFFLGGGFLEVSGECAESGTEATQIWLQVRDVHAAHRRLEDHGAVIEHAPTIKPWGLCEMRARDPDDRQLIFVEVPSDHPLRRDPRGRQSMSG